ncbi:TetR/AcrR family transcriptional regulator [Bhargavaea ullalensis]|uniref:TetR/AcrR family transcriptional regulator n=1 Tax=Bhargavaea ullalensis TaxID=1265685 RepID=UPI0035E6A1CC
MNERKQHVLAAARRLFLENGFLHTSIQNILDEAGISKGTFYNYFSSKNECLIEIIRQSWEESAILRNEIAAGRPDGPEVMGEQILIRLRLNREQNLLPLFDAILSSGDEELREFMKKIHLSELAWSESRIVEVYGEWTRPFAADAAVLQFGMLSQFLRFSAILNIKEDFPVIISFILRRLEVLLRDMADHNEWLIPPGRFAAPGASPPPPPVSETAERLCRLAGSLNGEKRKTGEEYAEFLSGELRSGLPRLMIIRTIAGPFRKLFEGTPLESEARSIMRDVWQTVRQKTEQPKEDAAE